MATATFAQLSQLQNDLIRKTLRGFIAVGGLALPVPTALTEGASAQLSKLPTGYARLGNISKKSGLAFARDTQSSDVESWGQSDPTRSDITMDVTNVTFECQETRRAVLETYYMIDLSSITPDATTGEVAFAQPTYPRTIYRRIVFVGIDGYGDDEVYVGKIMPRWNVTKVNDLSYGDDDALSYGITGNAKVDPGLGFAVKHFFGGPGWKARLGRMGFKSTWTVTIGGTPTGGTFTLLINGAPTAALQYNATTTAVQTAIETVVGVGNVAVTGSVGNYTVAFIDVGVDLGAISALTGGTPTIAVI